MAKNPMQKKAQNSFLLGMLITLLITGIIIALLVLQLTKMTKEQNEEQANLKTVYVVSQDIASGESVTTDKLRTQIVDGTTVPSNALTLDALEEKTNIYDEEGKLVKKVDVISKIDLKQGTIITLDMITESSELAADLRKQEYNMIMLPSQLESGQYIDIRLRLPNGMDYIVVSHKQVTIPEIGGAPSISTISLNVSETEILTLSCAIVECYKIEGSILYANKYVEPGLQTAATVTYIPNDDTITLISKDPNCIINAANAIIERYNNSAIKNSVRNPINSGLNENADLATENAVTNMEEELQKAQEEREKYLESLGMSDEIE